MKKHKTSFSIDSLLSNTGSVETGSERASEGSALAFTGNTPAKPLCLDFRHLNWSPYHHHSSS